MKVLIVRLSSFGDLFHALPAVHNLKVGLGAEIHWVANREYVPLVRCFTDVTRVIPFDRRAAMRRLVPFLRELRRERYDFTIDLHGMLKSAVVTGLSRAGRKIGPSFNREGARFFYGEVSGKPKLERHAVEQNLDVIDHLGLERIEPAFPVAFPDTDPQGARPRVGIVPISRWATKNWPLEYFAALMKKLAETGPVSFSLFGSEADRDACARLADEVGPGLSVQNLAGTLTMPETGGALRQMDLVVANDSGPAHMTAAVGVPTLVIFGPTDPAVTGPYGELHRVVNMSLSCRPCGSRLCREAGFPCMRTLTPEIVVDAALDML
ncbi:MAG: glycosyltransferase family 9 protein [Lentisphaerae bacterium]|nr:glycosyltransferase family 9 protein [Lentisphaerota bacterium]